MMILLLLCYTAINAAAIATVQQTSAAEAAMLTEKSATTASDESCWVIKEMKEGESDIQLKNAIAVALMAWVHNFRRELWLSCRRAV